MKKLLNELTKRELEKNFNKSEYARIAQNDSELTKLKEEIKNLIYKEYDKEQYNVRVSDMGTVFIDKIIEKTEIGMTTQEFERIESDNFKYLPYPYVMGRKISKKMMSEALKLMI